MNTVWHKGIPTLNGIYWFDTGFRHTSPQHASIIQVKGREPFVYGDYGSMPLSMVYSEKYCPNAQYANIEHPTKWSSIKDVLKTEEWMKFRTNQGKRRCWVKSKDLMSFGLLDEYAGDLHGTIIGLGHSRDCALSGALLRQQYDDHLISPIEIIFNT